MNIPHIHPEQPANPWDADTLRRRLDGQGRRHAAGSPSGEELAAYDGAIAHLPGDGTALVLGMTPELRLIAARRFDRVLTVDRNPAAVALYADWLPPDCRAKERIVEADWLSWAGAEDAPASCILADGVLPNLDPAAQAALLRHLGRKLGPEGLLVTRQPVIPPELETGKDAWPDLLDLFRQGALCDDALGLGLRVTGFLASCWRAADGHLDNAQIFAALDGLLADGALRPEEHAAAQRFRFTGPNWIFRREDFEAALAAAGWHGRRLPPGGRHWHAYYPLYACQPAM